MADEKAFQFLVIMTRKMPFTKDVFKTLGSNLFRASVTCGEQWCDAKHKDDVVEKPYLRDKS